MFSVLWWGNVKGGGYMDVQDEDGNIVINCILISRMEGSRIYYGRQLTLLWEAVESNHVADVREKWRAFVSTSMDLSVP
jgi:hypothetical protein